MRDGGIWCEKPYVDFGDVQGAVAKDENIGPSELALDLRAAFPPPADDIYHLSILGEQAGIGLCIVMIPSLLLACFEIANSRLVRALDTLILKGFRLVGPLPLFRKRRL